MLLNVDEVKLGNFKVEWNDLYIEVNSFFRKFIIDLMLLFFIDYSIISEFYCLLFEVIKKNRNRLSVVYVIIDVSFYCIKIEDFIVDSNFCDVNAKFCFEMEGVS